MLFNKEKNLVYKYSSFVLQVKTGVVTRQEALQSLLLLSRDAGNTDVSFACLVNSVRSIVGKDKATAGLAIRIFGNIAKSSQAGYATKSMMADCLSELNIPVYLNGMVEELKRWLRATDDKPYQDTNSHQTKYGVKQCLSGHER